MTPTDITGHNSTLVLHPGSSSGSAMVLSSQPTPNAQQQQQLRRRHTARREARVSGGIRPSSVWSVYFYTPPGCERGIDRQSLEFIQQKCRPHHRFFKYSESRAARCHSGINHQSRELSKTSTDQSNMRVSVASNQEARAENGRSQRAGSREASVRIHKCEAQRACLSPTSLCLTQNN